MPIYHDTRTWDDDGLPKDSIRPVMTVPGLAFGHGQATVSASVALRAINLKRRSILIFNFGPNTVFIGASGVTTGDGVPVASGASISLDSSAAAAIYAVSGGTSDLRFLEELAN